jgi:hypothetical protein
VDVLHATQNQDSSNGELLGTPADSLRVAATYIDAHGWAQGGLFNPDGGLFPAACVAGAIRVAVYGYPNSDPVLLGKLGWHVDMAMSALADYLGTADHDDSLFDWLDKATNAVHTWNDQTVQDETEVVRTLREAANHYDGGAE